MWYTSYGGNKMTFTSWMEQVDQELVAQCTLDSNCIVDYDWYGWFSSEVPPKEAAEMALQKEGFYKFVFGS